MNVLVACEFSGIVREAFSAKGHNAWSCDIIDTERQGKHIIGDVRNIIDFSWDIMVAHPPCTYLCVTGNKWMAEKYRDRFPDRHQQRTEAINFFMQLINADIDKICIENPVGIMSTHFRKPDQYIQPYQFGYPTTKKTGLWLKNLHPLKPTNVVECDAPHISKSGKKTSQWYYETIPLPADTRSKARSKTFQGVADAMAEQWG